MSSLIKGASGPLDGAAAVRELTSTPTTVDTTAARTFALPTVADLERGEHGDGEPRAFGPRPSRDPMAAIDQAADAQRAAHVGALLSAVAGLHVDEVRVLAWVAWQLPGRKLRRKCEEATATGWCRTEDPKPTARSTPEDRARAALLAAWRQVVALVLGAQSTAARDVAQRDRGDVLADEAARRAGGGE